MAYDEDLADRVRDLLPPGDVVREQHMFGGVAFMLGGHMFSGVVKDTLMVRLDPDEADRALEQPHVRPMDFTGRPMRGMLFIEPAGLAGEALGGWVNAAVDYARSRPPKAPKPAKARQSPKAGQAPKSPQAPKAGQPAKAPQAPKSPQAE